VKTEDEVVRLFVAANPVPRPELLDPPAPLDASSLPATIGTDDGSGGWMVRDRRAKWLLLPAVAAAAIAIAGLTVLLYRSTRSGDPTAVDSGTDSLEVAEAFMDAWEDGDGESVAAMFTADGGFYHWPSLIRGERESSGSIAGGPATESLPALHEWFEALDWDYRAEGCGRPTRVDVVACHYSFDNDVMEALRLDPVEGVFFLTIEDGKVRRARSYVDAATVGRYPFLWDRFLDFVAEAHPDEFAQMWDTETHTPRLDPPSPESWRRILDEFVAVEAGPWLTREKFIRQADAICRERRSRQDASQIWTPVGIWVFPHPDYAVAQLKALPLPERSRTEAEQLVTVSERFADLLRQIRAARDAGDEALADRLSEEALDLTDQLDGLLPGLEGCPVVPLPKGG
jgi:hypothetical protein